jgi:hypothetical protein
VGAVPVYLPDGKPGQGLLDADAALHAGQSGSQAEVDAEAQCHVMVKLAVDVETIRVGELALVPVGYR